MGYYSYRICIHVDDILARSMKGGSMSKPLISPPNPGDVAASFIVGLLVGGIGYAQHLPLVQLAGGGILAFSMLFVLGPLWRGVSSVFRSWKNSPFARRLTLSALIPSSSYVLAQTLRSDVFVPDGHFLLPAAMFVWMCGLVIWGGVELAAQFEESQLRRIAEERAQESKPVTVAQVAVAEAEREGPAIIVLDPDGDDLPDIQLDEVYFKDKDWLMGLMLRMPKD